MTTVPPRRPCLQARQRFRFQNLLYLGASAFYTTSTSSENLTHIDKHGKPAMANVSDKNITKRLACAEGRIFIPKAAFVLICNVKTKPESNDEDTMRTQEQKVRSKGNVCSVAQLAGIMYVASHP